jgi:septal ring factor EnvC (AmiA/AmiB activator)
MRIWPFSRIADIKAELQDCRNDLDAIRTQLAHINSNIRMMNTKIGTILPGLARVVAKLDAQYARDPQSPEMKAESDRLTEETIRRLEAEQAVRDQYGYTPDSELGKLQASLPSPIDGKR